MGGKVCNSKLSIIKELYFSTYHTGIRALNLGMTGKVAQKKIEEWIGVTDFEIARIQVDDQKLPQIEETLLGLA